MDLTYTAEEAADAIGISKNEIYSLMKRAEVPYVKFGRTVRIPKSAIKQWLDERANEHTEFPSWRSE